jgi:ribonuclease BN (tRNA processing enzyme)
MDIRILGAHNIESAETGFTSILIDGVLAVDAGALTSRLSLEEQGNLKAVVLTHHHYDHIRDIPAIGISYSLMGKTLDVYAPALVQNALSAHLINDVIYPDFTKVPPEKPSLRLHLIEPGKKESIAGYEVLPVSVKHAVPTVGYQVTAPDGKKVFYTSDTGPGLADVWQQVSPDVLLIEVTVPDKRGTFAHKVGHLTPALLQKELESFKSIKGYIPRVVLVHMHQQSEKQIKAEIGAVEKSLKITITFSHEGMTLKI